MLAAEEVEEAIRNDVIALHPGRLDRGQFFRGVIEVAGRRVEYHAFVLNENTINVGTYVPLA